jgi:hypothetical protein
MNKYFNLKIFAKDFITFIAVFTLIQVLLTFFNNEGPEKWNLMDFLKNRMSTGFVIAFVLSIFRTIKKSPTSSN